MTPRMKAVELFKKIRSEFSWVEKDHSICLYRDTKQCALIAVDELIYETKFEFPNIRQRYWIEVKQEINLL